jgi:hypothetical protein
LASMQHLEDVRIHFAQYSLRTLVHNDDRILPIQYGGRTLSKLWLLYEEEFLSTLGTHSLRDAFPNLTSLSLHPFTNDLCNYISTSSIRLLQFRTTITDTVDMPSLWSIASMISAPSLATLKELRIVFKFQEAHDSQYERIFRTICARLLQLEELVIGISFDTVWCAQLRNLQNLKRLVWYIPEADCHDSLHVVPEIRYLGDPDLDDIARLDVLRAVGWAFENYIHDSVFNGSIINTRDNIEVWVFNSNGCRNLCDVNIAPSIYADWQELGG